MCEDTLTLSPLKLSLPLYLEEVDAGAQLGIWAAYCTTLRPRAHCTRKWELLLLDRQRLASETRVRALCFEHRLVPAFIAPVQPTRVFRGTGIWEESVAKRGCALAHRGVLHMAG